MTRTLLLFGSLLIAPVLLAQYTATVKTSVTKTETSGWKKWSNAECAINYPASWTSEGAVGINALASFFAPADSAGRFRERVLLMTKDATGASLADLAKAMEDEARAALTDPRTISSNTTADAITVELAGTLNGKAVQVKQETSIHNNKAWMLTYMAAPGHYGEILYLADAVFMSLAVK